MKEDDRDRLSKLLPLEQEDFERFYGRVLFKEIPAGTILLSEGETATKIYLVVRGCLRGYFIKENGREITSQFFIENQMVSSFESVMTKKPSRMYIDAIEDSTIGIISFRELERLIAGTPSARDHFDKFLMTRLIFYMNQHASFILDSPEKRYRNLMRENPELVSRVPQQYIASYLGITPVSLSRIRARIKKKINNR